MTPIRDIQIDPTGREFPWGRVRKVHEVGPYYIIEYKRNRPTNAEKGWKATIDFHPYVKAPKGRGKVNKGGWYDTGHSYSSLDEALVACVAFSNEWIKDGINSALNSKAARYFMKMVRS